MKKTKNEIRSGFEALLIIGTALTIAPVTIIMASSASSIV